MVVVQVVPLDWSENFAEPYEILVRLNSIRDLVAKYVPFYAVEQTIAPKRYEGGIAGIQQISVVNITKYSCAMNLQTADHGWIFGIGVTEAELASGLPNPFQIFAGLQASNVQVKSFRKQMFRKNDNVTITNLEPGVSYKIYVISASDQPDYPDLGEESQLIECETEKLNSSKEASLYLGRRAPVHRVLVPAALARPSRTASFVRYTALHSYMSDNILFNNKSSFSLLGLLGYAPRHELVLLRALVVPELRRQPVVPRPRSLLYPSSVTPLLTEPPHRPSAPLLVREGSALRRVERAHRVHAILPILNILAITFCMPVLSRA